MARFEAVIDGLKKAQLEHAMTALARTEGTEFEFGLVCGIFQAYGAALQIVEGVLEKDDKGESTFAQHLKGTRSE
jgi:hypothetical protein